MGIILTKREAAVYDMLKEGYSRNAIAKLLSCAERTIETAIDNMAAAGVIIRSQPIKGKPAKITFTDMPFEVTGGKYRTRTGLTVKEKPKKPVVLTPTYPPLKGNYTNVNGPVESRKMTDEEWARYGPPVKREERQNPLLHIGEERRMKVAVGQ